MSNIILFKFTTDEPDKNRDIQFSKESTIEELLLAFLRETNSIQTLAKDKIIFWNKSQFLNDPKNLKKRIGSYYNSSSRNIRVRVTDTGKILGGINALIIFNSEQATKIIYS